MNKALELIGEFLVEKLQEELREQGHEATGDLINSINYKVVGENKVIISTPHDYVKAIENGLPEGTSVPIDALIRWIEVKGIVTGDKEIRQVAWAIRTAIYQQGTPTRGAFNSKFTKNGRRVGFAEYVMDEYTKTIIQMAGKEIVRENTRPIFDAVREIGNEKSMKNGTN